MHSLLEQLSDGDFWRRTQTYDQRRRRHRDLSYGPTGASLSADHSSIHVPSVHLRNALNTSSAATLPMANIIDMSENDSHQIIEPRPFQPLTQMVVEPGYNPSLFCERVDDFICPICQYVWRDPIEIGCPQQHILCRHCFVKHIESWQSRFPMNIVSVASYPIVTDSKLVCPLKCGQMDSNKRKSPHQQLTRMVSNLRMRCIYNTNENTASPPSICQPPPPSPLPHQPISSASSSASPSSSSSSSSSAASTAASSSTSSTTSSEDAAAAAVIAAVEAAEEQKQGPITKPVCDWIGTVGALDSHLSSQCPLHTIQCEWCDRHMDRYELSSHLQLICEFVPVECPKQCGLKIERKQLAKHGEKCPNMIVKCRHRNCRFECKRGEMRNHLKQCPLRPTKCPFSRYGCRRTIPFESMTAHCEANHVTHLELQNKFLQQKIDALEENQIKYDAWMERLSKLESQMSAHASYNARIRRLENHRLPPIPDREYTSQSSSDEEDDEVILLEGRCSIADMEEKELDGNDSDVVVQQMGGGVGGGVGGGEVDNGSEEDDMDGDNDDDDDDEEDGTEVEADDEDEEDDHDHEHSRGDRGRGGAQPQQQPHSRQIRIESTSDDSDYESELDNGYSPPHHPQMIW